MALSQNNNKAYHRLYTDYFGMVKYFVQKNSGSFEEAQDVFQDAIIVLYEKTKQPNFSLTCSLKTYLYSIVRNLWLKALSKKKVNVSITDYEKFLKVSVEDTSDELEKDKQIDDIVAAIKKLGDKCRKILTGFYFEKKKMAQIADELGYTNAQNAKSQKYKCMQQLKKLVK